MCRLRRYAKKLSTRKLPLLLGGISLLLLLAAAGVGLSIYNEGKAAQRNAEQLLKQYMQAVSSESEEPSPSMPTIGQEDPGTDAESAYQPVQTLMGYQVLGKLSIEKINVELPVIAQTSKEALKISVCYYQGAMPGQSGNMVITGHNYANGAHFGRLSKLKEGDAVVLEAGGRTYSYLVYETQVVKPDNVESLDEFEGDTCLTLLTCTNRGNRRLLVRCRLSESETGTL